LDKNRNPYFWSVVILYIFALIYGISVLKVLKADDSFQISNLQISIWISYFLGMHACISFFEHIYTKNTQHAETFKYH
jgi:cytochrome b subunit of formate dehydrogenase